MLQEQIQVLIERSRSGDKKAFEKLVVEFQPAVFRFAFRLLCNEDEAKDIVQETFIKVWLNLDKYREHYSFTTWIYKIACNLCYDSLRSTKHRFEAISEDFHPVSSENVEQAVINNDLKSLIVLFTRQLTPKQRLVFTLSEIEELNVEEIQTITRLSAAKIKSNLYLAKKQIKEKMNQIK
jgi:RNA polymerase sigma-70 factor (ECF subfamily)